MFDSSYEHFESEDYDRDVNEQRHFLSKIQQQVFFDGSDIEDHVCNMATKREEIILRKPSKAKIDQIIARVVA